MYSLWYFVPISAFVVGQTSSETTNFGNQKLPILQKELIGFDDVFTHLRSGYYVSFFIRSPDCDPNSKTLQFHEPFGDSIDFYFAYEDWRGYTVTQFTSKKYIRQPSMNTTSKYETGIVLRQGVIDRNDIATWNITVTSWDMEIIIESWTFTCYYGNRSKESNQMKFYTANAKPQQLQTLEDISSALIIGSRVRYSTWFIECQGSSQWLSIGGGIQDFDVIKVNNITMIRSTQTVLVRHSDTNFEHIIVTSNITKLFGAYTNFIITGNDYFNNNQIFRVDEKCIFQSSGGVNYYL